jgi:hypothetical protein
MAILAVDDDESLRKALTRVLASHGFQVERERLGLFFSGFKKACQTYLHDAITALRGGTPFGQPDTAKLLTFSNCMRAHGIPDFPDPSRTGLVLNGADDLNPNNPTFRDASKTCTNKTGV